VSGSAGSGVGSAGLDEAVRVVVDRLTSRGESVAVAESLTAGMVMERLGRVPGVSAVLRGGVVAYATELKTAMLGVPAETVTAHGVVSAETAVAMAAGVRIRCGSDWGISTTGVAGPDRQEGKPAGTAYVAVAGLARTDWRGPESLRVVVAGLDGTAARDVIRRAVSYGVLTLLSDTLAADAPAADPLRG
jgi:PncC family amidohydrolase